MSAPSVKPDSAVTEASSPAKFSVPVKLTVPNTSSPVVLTVPLPLTPSSVPPFTFSLPSTELLVLPRV